MLLKRTSLQFEGEALQELVQGGTLTNVTPGSRVRSIIAIAAGQGGDYMDALDVNTAMGFITSATGYFLDLGGQAFGVNRNEATAGFALKEDKSVRFYTVSGVLLDHLPSGFIPSGTVIQNSDASVQYTVVEDSGFPDDATEVCVSVIATSTGASTRIGRGQLTTHGLSAPGVLVTNDKPVDNGGDQETDDNYRYRILNSWALRATANLTAISLAALSTPGVADVVLTRHLQGPGTVDALLTPTGNRVTDAMIGGARARIDAISAGGDLVTVRGPRYVNIGIDTRLSFTVGTPDSEKDDIRDNVRDAQLDYLDDIPLGGQFILQELRARIQETSPRILDHEILCLTIDGRAQILRNIRLFTDELFLPDPDLETPITVL
jgi:uncharacterized phage protein gp47/JayE